MILHEPSTCEPNALELDLKYATISPCGKYRYGLSRIWVPEKPRVLFVMLNPSTADAKADDNTLRRCLRFAKEWGYGSLEVVNLYALRSTNPGNLLQDYAYCVGPGNDEAIRCALERAQEVVCAWGASYLNNSGLDRNLEVLQIIRKTHKTYCLEITAQGHPKHPLYVKADRKMCLYTAFFRDGNSDEPNGA